MLDSILTLDVSGAASLGGSLLCMLAALLLGVLAALCYTVRNNYSKSFVVTLALLPAMVQAVILLVNGNLGTGVAVMGAFSLVRFRSVPGSAREISALFLAMAIGLACGVGYVGYAAAITGIVCTAQLLLTLSPFGESKTAARELRVTLPEALEYDGIFDDLFRRYTSACTLKKVRTTGMGSCFELHYEIVLRDRHSEKAFLDALRCRNGNLTISCGQISTVKDEL